MLGLIIQLFISWILIRIFEKKDLSVLGWYPTGERVKGFFVFFFLTAFCCASGFLLRIYFGHETWALNPALNLNFLWQGIWWNIKSVLFEELIFRGVLLYILIQRTNNSIAILVSAIAFGIYHWFSQGSWGHLQPMLITFLLTGTMGWLYAYAYISYRSIYIPSAIHLGWNFTQSFVFSSGVIGNGILVLKEQPQVQVSLLVYYSIIGLPMLSVWLINYLLLKRKANKNLSSAVG